MCRTSIIEFYGTATSNSDLVVMFMHLSEIHRVSKLQADRDVEIGDEFSEQRLVRVLAGGCGFRRWEKAT
ncbi:hypothetical protein AAC387_Pa02g3105 [Persea americana]